MDMRAVQRRARHTERDDRHDADDGQHDVFRECKRDETGAAYESAYEHQAFPRADDTLDLLNVVEQHDLRQRRSSMNKAVVRDWQPVFAYERLIQPDDRANQSVREGQLDS